MGALQQQERQQKPPLLCRAMTMPLTAVTAMGGG